MIIIIIINSTPLCLLQFHHTSCKESSVFTQAKEIEPIQVACRLRPLDCRDRGFESRWEYECSSLVFVMCCIGSGICDKLISHSDESYQAHVLRSVCDLETSLVKRPTPELGFCGRERNFTLLLLNLQYLQHCYITCYIPSSFAPLKLSEAPSTALLSPEQRMYPALKALVSPPPGPSVQWSQQESVGLYVVFT
jgi:hypothetical protein